MQINARILKQHGVWAGGQAGIWRERETCKQADRRKQTDRRSRKKEQSQTSQSNRRTNSRQTIRQTDRHIITHRRTDKLRETHIYVPRMPCGDSHVTLLHVELL